MEAGLSGGGIGEDGLHDGLLDLIHFQAEAFWFGEDPELVGGPGAGLEGEVLLRLPGVVAVEAAEHGGDAALQLLAGELGKVEGRFGGGWGGMAEVVGVGLQAPFHEVEEALHAHGGESAATTVAVIDGAVGVGQKDGHGEVVVEDEGVQVDVVDVGDPDTDVVLRGFLEFDWGTDNLPVEESAINSRLAAEDDEERLALSGGLFAGRGEVGEPRKALGVRGGCAECGGGEEEDGEEGGFHFVCTDSVGEAEERTRGRDPLSATINLALQSSNAWVAA